MMRPWIAAFAGNDRVKDLILNDAAHFEGFLR